MKVIKLAVARCAGEILCKSTKAACAFALSLTATIAIAASAAAEQPRLTVDGTEFVLYHSDGTVQRGTDLAGSILTLHTGRIHILGVTKDSNAVGGDVFLYRLQVTDSWGATHEVCNPDINGQRLGFPLADASHRVNLTCTGGAEAKCVRFGYRPWEISRHGVPMLSLHRACTNLIRAAYGGDSYGTTRNGTKIDIYDRFGIQKPANDPTMDFEAAWGVDGARCVAHPRIAENITLKEVAARWPQLKNAVGEDGCVESKMLSDQASLLFNRSVDTDALANFTTASGDDEAVDAPRALPVPETVGR